MADYSNIFYPGAGYGFSSDANEPTINTSYRIPAGQFGFPTDPRLANQLDAVSKKLSTGAKTIEVSGVQAAIFETLPEQHLTEIYRLKKLVGADLTFHGPIIEPSGLRGGVNEVAREQAERQMWSAVKRAHKLDPKGNLVVTFHASEGLPEMETRTMTEFFNKETGKKENREQITEVLVVDEANGQAQRMPIKPDYFAGDTGEIKTSKQQLVDVNDRIKNQNSEAWFKQLQGVSFHASQGAEVVESAFRGGRGAKEIPEEQKKIISELYKKHLQGEDIEKAYGPLKDLAPNIQQLVHGDIYLRDAYLDLQKLFNQAY